MKKTKKQRKHSKLRKALFAKLFESQDELHQLINAKIQKVNE